MDYARIYREFISDRLAKQPEAPTYFERHHIIPRALGGGNGPENLIRLTPEDHIFAHILLAKAYGGRAMWAAVKFIFGQHRRRNGVPTRREIRLAAKAREEFAISNRGPNNCNFGKPISDAQKSKLRAANLGRKLSPEHRAKIAAKMTGKPGPNLGRKWSAEVVEKLRAASTGKLHSEQAKLRISESLTGRTLTPEHRAKLSISKAGVPRQWVATQETRRKLSVAMTGRAVSDETRQAIALANRSRVVTKETREKMSESRAGSGNSRACRVLCVLTGKEYGCIKDAALSIGAPQSTLRAALNRCGGRAVVRGTEFVKLAD